MKTGECLAILDEVEDGVTLGLLGEGLLHMGGVIKDNGIILLQAIGGEFGGLQSESGFERASFFGHHSESLDSDGDGAMPETTWLGVHQNLVFLARFDRGFGRHSLTDLNDLIVLGDQAAAENKRSGKESVRYDLFHDEWNRIPTG